MCGKKLWKICILGIQVIGRVWTVSRFNLIYRWIEVGARGCTHSIQGNYTQQLSTRRDNACRTKLLKTDEWTCLISYSSYLIQFCPFYVIMSLRHASFCFPLALHLWGNERDTFNQSVGNFLVHSEQKNKHFFRWFVRFFPFTFGSTIRCLVDIICVYTFRCFPTE